MTRETRKLDGEANKAEEHDSKSLRRDLSQSQSRREGPSKTGEASTERGEKQLWEKLKRMYGTLHRA